MRIPLTSPARKVPLVLASALLLSGYLWFAGPPIWGRLLFRTARSCQPAEGGAVATGQCGLSPSPGTLFLPDPTISRSCGGVLSRRRRIESISGALLVRSGRCVSVPGRHGRTEGGSGTRPHGRLLHSRSGLGGGEFLSGAGRHRQGPTGISRGHGKRSLPAAGCGQALLAGQA